jgi:hypothetical protein
MCATKRLEPPVPVTMGLGRWPRLQYALTTLESGYVDCDYFLIVRRMDQHDVTGVERAETWEELVRFYEWRLTTRADEMAKDPSLRYLLATWTDSMCYALRRSAALARGEDPGPVVTQAQRRPDLFAGRGIVVLAG